MSQDVFMELKEAQEILGQIDKSNPSAQWGEQLSTAVQRALAELYLLNPYDDVDGTIGPRTRGAWGFFKAAQNLPDPDAIDDTAARVLIQASSNPAGLIGQVKVNLQPDFEFRRGATQKSQNQDNSAKAIIDAASSLQLNKGQIAYILATAEHESDSFKTLEEYADGSRYEGRKDLGNTQSGDGTRFKGRGYVQLTGRRNYSAYAGITGIELVKLPVILMNWPALSVFVLVDGMQRGVYTGRRLDEFVNDSRQDFHNARQVVNDHDCEQKIADQANDWLSSL